MDSLARLFETFADAVRYPLDDPNRALVAVLVVVVAGLLVAMILIALASPGRRRKDTRSDAERPGPESSAD